MSTRIKYIGCQMKSKEPALIKNLGEKKNATSYRNLHHYAFPDYEHKV